MSDLMSSDVRVVAESDAGSFEEYVAAEQGALQNFAFLIVGNREDARDAVQDALIGAYRKWDAIRSEPGPYIRRSIVNAHISAWRKRRKEISVAEVTGGETAGPGVDTLWVRQMCQTLPRKQRAAVVLRYFEDRSFAEIGVLMDCSEATARSLVSRAIAALRRNLTTSDQ